QPNHIRPADVGDEFGVDGFRYHFLRDTPVGPDGDFSYERMIERYNGDLANNFGNLLSRVATVVGRKCGGIGPPPRAALEAAWRLIRETNSLLEEAEPWKLDPGPEVEAVLGDALEALRIVA